MGEAMGKRLRNVLGYRVLSSSLPGSSLRDWRASRRLTKAPFPNKERRTPQQRATDRGTGSRGRGTLRARELCGTVRSVCTEHTMPPWSPSIEKANIEKANRAADPEGKRILQGGQANTLPALQREKEDAPCRAGRGPQPPTFSGWSAATGIKPAVSAFSRMPLFSMSLFSIDVREGIPYPLSTMNMIFSIVIGSAAVLLVLRTDLLCLVRPASLTVETGVVA